VFKGLGLDDSGQNVVDKPLAVELRRLRRAIPFIVSELNVFVAAAPQRKAGMVADAPNGIRGFPANVGNEGGIVVRVHRTGERKVLPDQNAVRVAHLVKVVGLVQAAAPHAQHVEARVARLINTLLDAWVLTAVDTIALARLVIQPRRERVFGNHSSRP
jgi:hypothetical protein